VPKRVIELRSQAPLLDIVSYARGRGPLTRGQRAYIARTVRRVPEVVVKVSGGARTLSGVERSLKYIEKKGVFGLETDMDTRAGGSGFARDLVRDWDLDIEALKHYSKKTVGGKQPPKLVHNIIFSMPEGTSPRRVMAAVRKLALNEWALEHRYAMALHTDTPRPHVHVALKAVSEQGIRLNIKKATLRSWRAQFAENLRELGELANATERAVRGENRVNKPTSIFRADERGVSTHMMGIRAARHATNHRQSIDPGQAVLNRTRARVKAAWRLIAKKLDAQADSELAETVNRFVEEMIPARTEKAAYFAAENRQRSGTRDGGRSRTQ
jgi:Relaxase/Mobilisation nuclease domain